MDNAEALRALEILADMAHMEAEEYAKAGGGGRVESLHAIIRQALTAPRVPEGWCVSTSKYGIIVTGPHGQSGEAVRPGTGFGSTDPVVYRLLQELFAAAQAPAEVNFVEAFNGDVPFPAPGQSLAEACAYVNGVAGGLYVGKHNQARKDADELATLRERYDALLAKHQDVLDTVQQCACAYDGPQDVCVGHAKEMAALRERVKVLELTAGYAAHDIDNIALLLRGEEDLQKLCRGIAERLRDGEGR